MKSLKKVVLPIIAASLLPLSAQASLTLYTTSLSMYGENAYEYDGAYKMVNLMGN